MPSRPTLLDELVVTVVVDNETDNLSSTAPGIPRLPEVASLLGRIAPTRTHRGQPAIPAFEHLCVACHGLSVAVTGRVGDVAHTVLFDVGPYGDVWLANAERLGLDLSAIEAVFLSHWHWDHSGGLPLAIAAIADARGRAGLPAPVVDLHPDRPDQRGTVLPSGTVVLLAPEPTLDALADAGGAVELHREAHLLGGGFLLGSGEIPRLTEYETGLAGHVTFDDDGDGRPDPLILDERFLAAHVRGRGVTVLSACSHAGIVNVGLAAGAFWPDEPIDLLLGGFHLAGGAMEERIGPTVDDLVDRVSPRILAPGHCTGWRAKAALAARFAPDHYAPSVVGSTYVLTAS